MGRDRNKCDAKIDLSVENILQENSEEVDRGGSDIEAPS